MNNQNLILDNNWLSFQQIKLCLTGRMNLGISKEAKQLISKCREFLDNKLQNTEELYYGINTGFGFLQNVRINKDQLKKLQENLLQSHACGIGEEVPVEIVRLMLLLKIKSLSYGFSGVSTELVDRLINMYNQGVNPVVYTQGSLGASGDLCPLSHLSLPLIDLGEVIYKGEKRTSHSVNEELGWAGLSLKSKEGLALINGTQFMSAYALHILILAERLIQWADIIATIAFNAFDCIPDFLHEKIHSVRPHKGQVDTAKRIRDLLEGSEIIARKKTHVQDPYSFRCIPQVHGATKDTFEFTLKTILTEINSVTDNPNIFPDDDLILSGGNFHGQPLALVLDFLSIAMSELGNISERRTFQLLSGQRGLPLFLVKDPGLHSGLMIPQYTAASIVSENKQLCTPASIDSISSSNNQEDHVSMGANAATKCLRIMHNIEKVLAIELLTAAQAMDFRGPIKTSPAVQQIISNFRNVVSFNDADRVLHNDIVSTIEFMRNENTGKKFAIMPVNDILDLVCPKIGGCIFIAQTQLHAISIV